MAFSHRPTWHAARGGGSTFDIKNYVTGGLPSRHLHTQDMPNHAFLKFRQPTQGTKDEVARKDLKTELLLKEKEHFEKQENIPAGYGPVLADKDKETLYIQNIPVTADGKVDFSKFGDSDDELSSDSDSDDESEDEDAELLRELEIIKKEREAAKKRNEEQDLRIKAQILEAERVAASGTSVKRRWDEDIVFRNQAKFETKRKKRFINDTIRNDFHKNFLRKYVK